MERFIHKCFNIQLEWYYGDPLARTWAKQFQFVEEISLPQIDMWVKFRVKDAIYDHFLHIYQLAIQLGRVYIL